MSIYAPESYRNSTGITGVHLYSRTTRIRRGKGWRYNTREVFSAQHPDGKRRREFSIRHWGHKTALALAIEARAQFVAEHNESDL